MSASLGQRAILDILEKQESWVIQELRVKWAISEEMEQKAHKDQRAARDLLALRVIRDCLDQRDELALQVNLEFRVNVDDRVTMEMWEIRDLPDYQDPRDHQDRIFKKRFPNSDLATKDLCKRDTGCILASDPLTKYRSQRTMQNPSYLRGMIC